MSHKALFKIRWVLFAWAITTSTSAQQVYQEDSPGWLTNVGKLTVPGQIRQDKDWNHVTEHCTGTLISRGAASRAYHVISAWHCIEFYRDLSQDIKFQLPGSDAVHHARVIASGGSMEADWALLKLSRPITISNTIRIQFNDTDSAQTLSMAGYSSGALGKLGEAPLSYDPNCKALEADSQFVWTDCQVSKGASGGPVIGLNSASPVLLGVISQGDSNRRSQYVPVRVFAGALKRYL